MSYNYDISKVILLGKTFTREDAYRLKFIIDQQTEKTSKDEAIVIEGVEVIQSVSYAPQRVYLHPFTLARFLKSTKFNSPIDVLKTNAHKVHEYLTPLSESELATLKMCDLSAKEQYKRILNGEE